MCVCVCMCVHVCVCVHACIRVCVCARTCVCVGIKLCSITIHAHSSYIHHTRPGKHITQVLSSVYVRQLLRECNTYSATCLLVREASAL